MNDVNSRPNLSFVRRGPKFVVSTNRVRTTEKSESVSEKMIESNATLSFLVLAIHFENSIFDVTSIFANEYNRVVGAVR